jgi:hypothetical protein
MSIPIQPENAELLNPWKDALAALKIRAIPMGIAAFDHRILSKATLNKSLVARSTSLGAPCSVANPRHSRGAMAVVCALQCIPNKVLRIHANLFSVALKPINPASPG